MRTIFSFGLLLSVFSIENASGTARMITLTGVGAATGFVRASATPKGSVQRLRGFWEGQTGNSFVKHTEQKILDLNTKPSLETPLLRTETLQGSLDQKPAIPTENIGLLQKVQEAELTARPLDQSLNPGSHSATPLTKKVTLYDAKNNYLKGMKQDLSPQELKSLKQMFVEAREEAWRVAVRKAYQKDIKALQEAGRVAVRKAYQKDIKALQEAGRVAVRKAYQKDIKALQEAGRGTQQKAYQKDAAIEMERILPKDQEDQGTGLAILINYEDRREKPLLTRVGSNILSLVKSAAQKILP